MIPLEHPGPPKMTPGTYKIMVFVWNVFKIQGFQVFEKDIKKLPRDPPRGGKMEAKIPLGAPQDAEKWSQNFSGAPPAKTSEFFFRPRRPPGALRDRFL